jgi:hypothetical protein
MPKVLGNLVINRLSGTLGDQLVIRTSKGRTIVAAKPTYSGERVYSPAQLAQQQAFREAAVYAKQAKGQEIYSLKANGGPRSPYNIAFADWLNRPQILEVDLTGWRGASGDLIRLRAQDDVQVTEVAVTISDDEGAVLEAGLATDLGALWWEYTTASSFSGRLTLTIAAKDLPGHTSEYSQVRTLSGS